MYNELPNIYIYIYSLTPKFNLGYTNYGACGYQLNSNTSNEKCTIYYNNKTHKEPYNVLLHIVPGINGMKYFNPGM